ncbi:hypothetical protein [Hyphomicrobium sp.]|jgi:hypothetical protein|uniref:hypothetical protein n=1 Tax=Hyphomicrobium sp. TaxID=82 RepID=UPI00356A8C7E
MSLSIGTDELLRATKKALADSEVKLKQAHSKIVRQDAEDAITRSGASSSRLLADNMAAVGRVAENGRDVEYDVNGRWVDRDTYVSDLRRSEDTSKFFADAVAKKSPVVLRDNPFSRASFNLTKQMQLIREDPDLAARLRREAD